MKDIQLYRQHLKECAAQYALKAQDERRLGYEAEAQKLDKASKVLQNELIVFDSLMGYEEKEED